MKRLREWMLRAGFSILDQALASTANFGLSVALARVLPDNENGAFALSFSIFLVISGFHNVLLIEPMSVLGPARHARALPEYIRRVAGSNFPLMGAFTLLGSASAAFFWNSSLGPALLSMSLSMPFILLFWLMRRAHYLETQPLRASACSAIYLVTLSIAGVLLWRLHALSAAAAFGAMAVAGVAASAFSIRSLGLQRAGAGFGRENLAATWREHWNFGRWLLPSALLYPLVSQVQILLVGRYLGLGPAGVFRALQNPILPVLQVVTALATLAIPLLAREFGEGRTAEVYRRGGVYTAAMIGVALCYETAVLATGSSWDRLLYGSRYTAYDWLMPVLGLMPIAAAISTGCSAILRAIQKPEMIMTTHIFGAVAGVAASFGLIPYWKLAGATYALLASQGVTAVVCVYLALRSIRTGLRPVSDLAVVSH